MRDPMRQMAKRAVRSLIRDCREDERGATMIEYSLLIGLIAAAMIGLLLWVSDWMAWTWQNLVDAIGAVGP